MGNEFSVFFGCAASSLVAVREREREKGIKDEGEESGERGK
jgi:hypothetical protein